MVSSMTGFGRASAVEDGREFTVELKSVNHRYLDLNFRMPRHIGFVEDTLRKAITDALSRGHVEVYVNYRNLRSDARRVEIDAALLGEYLRAAREAAKEYELKDDIGLSRALGLQDVTDIVEAEEDRDAVNAVALTAVGKALEELKKMRALEGGRLADDLIARAKTLSEIGGKIALRAPTVVEEYRVKLTERIEALLNGTIEVDRARLATEVALFADKASIDEELVRLKSHLAQTELLLNSGEPAGRKLDFIVQELNREFNTIGSKANDAEIVRLVVSGKAEIEKIREQVQNIE
ncbi:MAG: YicC/YloC family endoribonuclease [Clostridiaceae bacterium]|nr:YicC family protein [Eubacteriales bacterium]